MMYFLDTNICVYFMKGLFPKIEASLKNLDRKEVKICSIVKAELLLGAEKSTNRKIMLTIVSSFLHPFEIIPFDSLCSEHYGRVRATLEQDGCTIGPNDCMIASTVLAHDGVLVTNNEKEFKRIDGLIVQNWC